MIRSYWSRCFQRWRSESVAAFPGLCGAVLRSGQVFGCGEGEAGLELGETPARLGDADRTATPEVDCLVSTFFLQTPLFGDSKRNLWAHHSELESEQELNSEGLLKREDELARD
jgi:hypothetical protein